MAATQRMNIDILARDKTAKAVNSSRKRFEGLKKSLLNVKTAMAGIGFALLARNLIKTGMSIEGLQVRLKFLFGTAEEGAKAFDKMAEFASKVPFSLEQIQQGAGVLAVVSKDANQLAKIMEITGNVAAVTGLDFKTTAEQIQRSLSAGISAADLFREKGVRDMLGFQAGATVSIQETVVAFERVFGKGGRFGNATDELAKTFEGTLSMIGDKIFNFKRAILEAGLFPELKKQFGDLDNFLADNGEQIDKIAKTIGETLGKAVAATADGMKFLAKHSDALLFTLKALVVLKLAKLFWAISVAIGAASVQMANFNLLTKKNIILLGATGLVIFWEQIGKQIDKVRGKVEELKEILPKPEEDTKKIEKYTEATTTLVDETKALADATKNLKKITDGLLTDEESLLQTRDKTLESLKQNAAFVKLALEDQEKWIGRVSDEYEEQQQ